MSQQAASATNTVADAAKAKVKANLAAKKATVKVAPVKAAPVLAVAPAVAKPSEQASVKGEPTTNFVAHDVNGRHLALVLNGTTFQSTNTREGLGGVQYGPVYKKDDLFVTITKNTVADVSRGVAGIQGRWNTTRPSMARKFSAGETVLAKGDRPKPSTAK